VCCVSCGLRTKKKSKRLSCCSVPDAPIKHPCLGGPALVVGLASCTGLWLLNSCRLVHVAWVALACPWLCMPPALCATAVLWGSCGHMCSMLTPGPTPGMRVSVCVRLFTTKETVDASACNSKLHQLPASHTGCFESFMLHLTPCLQPRPVCTAVVCECSVYVQGNGGGGERCGVQRRNVHA
jgi:hypothetical protein